jgi:hypothetical protein
MPKMTGKNLYVAFNGIDLSAEYRSFDPGDEIELVDKSSGTEGARTYLTTLADGEASYAGLFVGTAPYEALKPGTEGTLEWGPEGTAVGKERNHVNAIVRSRNRTFPYAGLVELKATFQYSGTPVVEAYA